MTGSPLDLRQFLDHVRDRFPREYRRIDREVSPDWEMAGIAGRFARSLRAPVLEFSTVRGTAFPVVTNTCASLRRIADSLGVEEDTLRARLRDSYDHPVPPVVIDDGDAAPCRQHILRGEQVDLTALPGLRYTEAQTERYITAGVFVARDPESSVLNLSFHRLMVAGPRRGAAFVDQGGHLASIIKANAQRGLGTPVAVFVGGHPAWMLGALGAGGIDVDEFALIGAIQQQPLDVTPALTDERLLVPAHAEFVIEGCFEPGDTMDEGPFGEFAGYVMPVTSQPALTVRTISHRSNPIFVDIVAGSIEQLTMSAAALSAYLESTFVDPARGILRVHLPAPLTLNIQVNTSTLTGAAHDLLRELLRRERYVKHAYCFDHDVDISNPKETQWAMATRFQADRDLVVLAGEPGGGFDPSERERTTTRCGFDATAFPTLDAFPSRNAVPPDVDQAIDLDSIG